ncbi:GyrI-like domain-containing protein [Paraglaciecola sp.]|uniref:AraC family transcriptional regulator n=1 Tax=Paraglaciecola sp. TaxID=1920173 RepID=UPI0030F413ED
MADYKEKINSVLEYIDNQLEAGLAVTELSVLACLSKFHFHRIFVAHVGMSAGKYIRLMRFKKVSYQLVFRPRLSITDIAFSAGFESTASLSREFKSSFGSSPTQFRKSPDWSKWQELFDLQYAPVVKSLNLQQINLMRHKFNNADVKIVHFKAVRVAVKEHRGDPATVMQSVATFIKWRMREGLSPKVSATYNILYDDPDCVEPADFCMDICVQTDKAVAENADGIVVKHIPCGKCAVFRHLGCDQLLGQSFESLYSQWLPQSGEILRDYPCFLHRVNFYPDVPENQSIIDIYLPLQ